MPRVQVPGPPARGIVLGPSRVARRSSGQRPAWGRETARRRLNGALARLHSAGLEVEGVLGDSDPMLAVKEIWDPARFDEIIVFTLPARISNWLKRDLPCRVERHTGKSVTHVIASEAVESPQRDGGPVSAVSN